MWWILALPLQLTCWYLFPAIRHTLNQNPKFVREHIMNEVSQILACYRKNCANPSSAGQLILPECMKLLPLYANCIIKSDGIQGGELSPFSVVLYVCRTHMACLGWGKSGIGMESPGPPPCSPSSWARGRAAFQRFASTDAKHYIFCVSDMKNA